MLLSPSRNFEPCRSFPPVLRSRVSTAHLLAKKYDLNQKQRPNTRVMCPIFSTGVPHLEIRSKGHSHETHTPLFWCWCYSCHCCQKTITAVAVSHWSTHEAPVAARFTVISIATLMAIIAGADLIVIGPYPMFWSLFVLLSILLLLLFCSLCLSFKFYAKQKTYF